MAIEAIGPGKVAVVTGGASGIGLAAAKRLASNGMKVCIVDRDERALDVAVAEISSGGGAILGIPVDVSRRDEVERLAERVDRELGPVDVLMNNAGIQPGTAMFGPLDVWQRVLDVNLWGIVNGSQVFAPRMVEHGSPALIINTGSKQGITTPPGDPGYNVSKAAVKAFTEGLAHELRSDASCRVTAHLLIPGFVFTGLTAKGRTEKPDAAWTADETVDFMLGRLEHGDFYILCPDNDVSRATDERRILWAAGDIVENRPALSRWHPDYAEAFKAFAAKEG